MRFQIATVRLLQMSFQWERSLESVDGVGWVPLLPINRDSLPGIEAEPKVEMLQGYSERPLQHVEWIDPQGKLKDQMTSPSGQREGEFRSDPELAAERIAKVVSEALALPGTRSDYHFSMLGAWEALYGRRRADSRVFCWIEKLCLADIRLMELGPELVFAADHWGDRDEDSYPVFPAFHQLSTLYQREGFLADAVKIEKRGAALGSSRPVGEGAIARHQALLQEDGR